ncbi:hypothetical protein J5U22_03179 [Saccharolobus shibatae]|uniref:DNA primase/nucleoside triphosphatase C-terminal domain-containing protein n=2 Tax=Saccharolobus shibatae TaxID=2286 RepID=A0A8F5H2W4_9CREN|nr:hypothetical protein J5U22_03179 [Saccharolobus shibatae]
MKDLIESGKAEYDPKNGDLFTPVKELYQAYTRWCEENDKRPEDQASFTKRLETRFRITKDRKKVNDEKIACYVGIRLKEESTGGEITSGDHNNSLLELYKEYQGKIRSRKDLQDELGIKAYELLDWCEKKGLCYWIDEEHVRFN